MKTEMFVYECEIRNAETGEGIGFIEYNSITYESRPYCEEYPILQFDTLREATAYIRECWHKHIKALDELA